MYGWYAVLAYLIYLHCISVQLFRTVVSNLVRAADRFETEFFFVDRPLKNHECFSNKTARIYAVRLHEDGKSAKFFRVSLKKKVFTWQTPMKFVSSPSTFSH